MSQPKQSATPLISVITVVLNGEATIGKTIESVINQSYSHWEYIIIDGASSDRTLEIIASYQDKRITHCISEADSGIYEAMNKGIALAKGDFIGILNSGDRYIVDTLATVNQTAQDTTAAIITGAMVRFDVKESIYFKLNKTFVDLQKNIHWGMPINHPATFVRSDVYRQLGGFNSEYRICADYDLIYRAYFQKVEFAFTSEVLAYMSLGGVSEQFSSLTTRCREHFLIERAYTPLIVNLSRRVCWLLVNLTKHLLKSRLSSRLMMQYYQLRHGI